ncbi:MAG: LPS assembly protein LptD [Gammaproteobacteria bacterium]|nr:LPS assembly protein LptD [Gammaproteobacteria bacterium]
MQSPLLQAAVCPAPSFIYKPGNGIIDNPELPVQAQADRVVSEDGVVTLEGNTTIVFQGRELSAENATYQPDTGEVTINGALSFFAEGMRLESNNAQFDMDDNIFSTGETSYEMNLNNRRATGTAESMQRDEQGNFELTGATYSTCPPEDRSWYLRANSIKLYSEEGIGIAKSISLRFKGVPLLAVPAFSFPISDKRKTGFLAPVLARGENTGLELQIPWYWNIRPDMDATFTPRFTAKRGVQLKSELRYLNTQGQWWLDNEYLEDRERSGETRHFTQIRHEGRFGPFWSSNIFASRVSDKDYFQDLGNSLQVASISHLERRADLTYDYQQSQIVARFQSFQTVNEDIPPEERPYRRMPQVTFTTKTQQLPLGLRAEFDSEAVYFDRDESVKGLRLNMRPELSLPITRDAWFIKPTLAHQFSNYQLSDAEEGQQSSRSRNISSFSIDGGLYFDRVLEDSGSVLTLEPRIFYLRVPYEPQNNIPVFDSSAFDFNIAQLFRENRFSGGDRVADANQVSLALTSRLIDGQDGRERLSASIGQIFYADDRRVNLIDDVEGGDNVETRDTSDFVGEVAAVIDDNWIAKSSLQWNPDDDRTVRGSLLLSYRPGPDRIVNFAHRNVNTGNTAETEQLDISALWPIADNWRLAGRWNFSLDADKSIESVLGLEYESCCWAMRFAARRYISAGGTDTDTNLYLQLVLKGLAPLGQNYGALLENSILGYRDQY